MLPGHIWGVCLLRGLPPSVSRPMDNTVQRKHMGDLSRQLGFALPQTWFEGRIDHAVNGCRDAGFLAIAHDGATHCL